MPIKYNNTITVRLSDEQIEYLMNLMNNVFCIDSMADAIRYCINSEIHYSNISKKLAWDGKKLTCKENK